MAEYRLCLQIFELLMCFRHPTLPSLRGFRWGYDAMVGKTNIDCGCVKIVTMFNSKYSNYTRVLVRTECSPEYNHSLGLTTMPPSIVIVAPVTYDPAWLLKKRHAPATSSGLPIRLRGIPATRVSSIWRRVAAIILLRKGPHASVLDLKIVRH